MARPKEYDEDAVRARALLAFLRGGYDGTSVGDLEAATDLNRRSLYNAFGDKKALFLRALGDFQAAAGERYLAPLEGRAPGAAAVREVFARLLAAADTEEGRLGCLVCNTAASEAGADPDIKAQVARYFDRVERGFHRALSAARDDGALAPDADIQSLAQFYLGVLVSVCVMCRGQAPTATLSGIVEEALRKLA